VWVGVLCRVRYNNDMENEIVMDGKIYLTASEAARLTGYTNDYIGQLCRAGKVEGKVIGRTRYVCRESLNEYDTERKEMVTAGRHRSGFTVKCAVARSAFNDQVPGFFLDSRKDNALLDVVPAPSGGIVFRTTLSLFSIFVVIVTIVFIPGMHARIATLFPETSSKIHAEALIAGSAAFPDVAFAYVEMSAVSVYRTIVSVGTFTGQVFSRGVLTLNTLWTTMTGQHIQQGLVVVPSTGSDERNKELEARVRSSFSDEVEISINEDGSSGVIRPVFKSDKEDEYLFVMVPLGG
jgi:hypothetical protein